MNVRFKQDHHAGLLGLTDEWLQVTNQCIKRFGEMILRMIFTRPAWPECARFKDDRSGSEIPAMSDECFRECSSPSAATHIGVDQVGVCRNPSDGEVGILERLTHFTAASARNVLRILECDIRKLRENLDALKAMTNKERCHFRGGST